ncbi:MAG: molybdopterin-dependent oxidoreductase [Anaerolineae bacterium]|nr:molybdopterin-dependent oxidoreductase [Anaerolineae bacterium]
MQDRKLSRRELLVAGGATIATMALLNSRLAFAAPLRQGDEVLPWLDQPEENPVPEVIDNQLVWEEVDAWLTPNDKFFGIAHYGWPQIEASQWRLAIDGMVANQLSLTLAELKARPRQELTFTLECAGNHGLPFFDGGIGNARWAGTSLAALLAEAEVLEDGIEVVFFGTDQGEETVRETEIVQNFARSMSLADAMHPDNLLCYEMNGEPLPARNGAPLRLIAPGWYGIANVKWLQRIEIWNTRLANRFMARDYVTLRQEGTEAEPVWTESLVGRALLKSAPARVIRNGDNYRIEGAAWGAPIRYVDVKIDDGPWQRARLDRSQRAEDAWNFWTYGWADATPGEHTVTTRAVDTSGKVQPTADDPWLANKVTYWESNGQITRRVDIPT